MTRKPTNKLDKSVIEHIRKLWLYGYSRSEIAIVAGVSVSSVKLYTRLKPDSEEWLLQV